MTATSTIWESAAVPPNTARTVVLLLQDGTEVRGFYWRPENKWYPERGSKRRNKSLPVTEWKEV